MTRIICWGLGYWFDKFVKSYDQTKIEIVAITDKNLETAKAKQKAFGLKSKVITADEVSIDTDLYSPTYTGLKWFWERLSPGGYIMVHDYDCPPLPGVKDAVDRFAKEYGVPVFPLCDTARSAVIAKNDESCEKGK